MYFGVFLLVVMLMVFLIIMNLGGVILEVVNDVMIVEVGKNKVGV